MSMEKYYEVLGLRPGASEQEVRNAYRDLAKVWHPDRFAQDPRLQQKAQEKLKEINAAYEQINSPASSGRRRARRPPTPPPPSSTSAPRTPRGPADYTSADFTNAVARRGGSRGASRLTPVAFALAATVVTFFASYRFLNSPREAPAVVSPRAAAQAFDEGRAEEVSDAGERGERKAPGRQPRAGEGAGTAHGGERATSPGAREAAPAYKALPTVNRTIDPTTGLLATRACPLKALRTFASGQEPQKLCDADHTRKSASAPPTAAPAPAQAAAAQSPAPPAAKQKSRLKTVLGAVASPGKWFRRTEAPRGETKSGAGQE